MKRFATSAIIINNNVDSDACAASKCNAIWSVKGAVWLKYNFIWAMARIICSCSASLHSGTHVYNSNISTVNCWCDVTECLWGLECKRIPSILSRERRDTFSSLSTLIQGQIYPYLWGCAVVSYLVRCVLSSRSSGLTWAIAGKMCCVFWARQVTLTVPLSTQV